MARDRRRLSLLTTGAMLSFVLLSLAAPAMAYSPAQHPEGSVGGGTPTPPPVTSKPWRPDQGMARPEGDIPGRPVHDQPGHPVSDPGTRPEGGNGGTAGGGHTGGQGSGGGGAGHAQGSPAPIAGLGFGALFAIGAGYSFLKRRVRARA